MGVLSGYRPLSPSGDGDGGGGYVGGDGSLISTSVSSLASFTSPFTDIIAIEASDDWFNAGSGFEGNAVKNVGGFTIETTDGLDEIVFPKGGPFLIAD